MSSRPPIQFGVHLPVRVMTAGKGEGSPASHSLLAGIVGEAASQGYTAFWVTDHIVFQDPWMDCLLMLASVAGQARGLKIATGVLGLPLRHPVAVAQTLATLDILSEGNLIIGVGEGSTKLDFDALGVPFDDRRKRLEEGIPLLRRLLSEDHVTHHGIYYSFENVSVEPKPLQRPYPPIWLSSWGSAIGLRRVARLGDGWVSSAWHSTPEEFGTTLRTLEGELEARGKTPATFPHAANTMFVYADPSDSRARKIAGPIIQHTTGEFETESGHYIVGDYSRCCELLGRWVEQGCRHIAIWPVTDQVEQVRRFGQHILPQL